MEEDKIEEDVLPWGDDSVKEEREAACVLTEHRHKSGVTVHVS